jgi:hypothetical protein
LVSVTTPDPSRVLPAEPSTLNLDTQIFIRKQVRCQDKAPVQLDLFKPTEYGYEFKVIVTNKCGCPHNVVAFHEGSGSQEGIFAELKSHCQMDYVRVNTRVGNQLYMFAGILAHNLTRESQIELTPKAASNHLSRRDHYRPGCLLLLMYC